MNPCGCAQTTSDLPASNFGGACGSLDKLTAKDVMQYGVVSVEKSDPAYRAVSLLLDRSISGLPVTDCGRLAGMISERDLLRLVHKEEYLPGQVADYMTTEVVSVGVDDPLSALSRLLVDTPFRRVPVLLHQRTLAGIVSRADGSCQVE
ncbi:MAG TPA: CBS domain-containing protein [Sedimentisphaerales bacterium]|nr:CBS domain-containing protein [Sedimentisphaerales bacterium]